MNKNTCVVMICTSARGGMRSVLEGYRNDGFFDAWNVLELYSHIEGPWYRKMYVFFISLCRLIGIVVSNNVQLIHIHSAMRGSFWRKSFLSIVALLLRIPVVFHLHGSEMKLFVDSQNWVVKKIIAWILERQSVVVVLSESWKSYINCISPKANVEVLPNYVRMPPPFEKLKSNFVRVSFLGIVGQRKGVYDLLPAFCEAKKVVDSLRLVVAGNGEVSKAQKIADQIFISESVEFKGWIDGEKKLSLLRETDIFVLPSYNEGLPISVLEAMSYGIPVVTTNVGGIPELVRADVDGYLLAPGDRVGLTRALISLAKDEELRNKMGRSGFERVRGGFSDKVILPRLDAIYRSVAKN